MEEWSYIFGIFKEYEKKFTLNLYCAWDFDTVDWLGLAKAAEQAIKSGAPLTLDQINKYHGCDGDEGIKYVL